MFVVRDNKLTTVIIWVSTIIIFLLLALLALMAGILYSKQQSDGVQVNILPGQSVSKAQPQTAPAPVAQQPATAAPPVQQAAAPRPAAPASGEKIYVLINGQLVPLELNAINRLAQVDQDMQQAQEAARRARELAEQVAVVDEQKAREAVATRKAEQVTTGDGNKVVLTQAKYGRGLESQLQLMGMAAADLFKKKGEADEVAQVVEQEAQKKKKNIRYVRVKEGDSLWSIAVRAYGNGFAYKRILEANPQIKNPDQLVAGMLLRVPM